MPYRVDFRPTRYNLDNGAIANWEHIEPEPVALFNLDRNLRVPRNVKCKYLIENFPINPLFNLNTGIERVVRRRGIEKFHALISYINLNHKKLSDRLTYLLNYDVVCTGDLLLQIMNSAYDRETPWTVLATKVSSVTYLRGLTTAEKLAEIGRRTEEDLLRISFDYRFKDLMFSSKTL